MTEFISRAEIRERARLLLRRPKDVDAAFDEAGIGHPAHELDFTIRPVSKGWRLADRHPAYRTAVANVAYIFRSSAPRDCYGRMPSWFAERHDDLIASDTAMPSSAPMWAREPFEVWHRADAATDKLGDPTEVSAWHILAELPDYIDPRAWEWLVRRFVDRELVRRGAVVSWAIHALLNDHGGWAVKPHVHMVVTARRWRSGRLHGFRMFAWGGSWSVQHRLGKAWRRSLGLARVRDKRLSIQSGWAVPFVMCQQDVT